VKYYPLVLTHVGGSKRTVDIIGAFPGYLSVRWGGSNFDVFEVCMKTCQLVRFKGLRVTKRFKWMADMEECKKVYLIMRSKK